MLAAEPPTRLAYLDGWRGLSLIVVLLGHFARMGAWVAPFGVEMFFALSGRLMADLLILRRQPLPSFLWRRVARVWPALWVYVGLVSVALAVSAWWGDRRNVVAGALASLTFTQNYVSARVSVPYFDHHWSLAVEEHAYLLLALLVVLAGRRATPAAALALAVTAAAWLSGWTQMAVFGGHPYYTWLQTDARAGSVLLPFALYLIAHSAWGSAQLARLRWLSPIALGLALGCAVVTPIEPLRYTLGTALLALGVATIHIAPATLHRLLAMPALTWVGAASFSLYLWQQPFMILSRAGVPATLCALGGIGIGLWSYYRVEQPTRRLLNAFQQRSRGPARPAHALGQTLRQ